MKLNIVHGPEAALTHHHLYQPLKEAKPLLGYEE